MRGLFFVGSEEEKERKVVITHFGGEERVVQRAKELIKAEAEEGGMRAFVESRAESAKPTEIEEKSPCQDRKGEDKDKAGWSALLALFQAEPKAALAKLVGNDTSPAAMDEALAALRAKTYEPVVLFAPEAVHLPALAPRRIRTGCGRRGGGGRRGRRGRTCRVRRRARLARLVRMRSRWMRRVRRRRRACLGMMLVWVLELLGRLRRISSILWQVVSRYVIARRDRSTYDWS